MKFLFNDFLKIFSNIPFLACLSQEELAEIESVIVVKKFLKNEVILVAEEESAYFYFILSGKIKVIQINESGKELMLAIHKRGDYFGEMSILDGKTAPATIVAAENSTVGFITKDNFKKYIINNEKSLRQIIPLLCSRLRDAWSMLKIFAYDDAKDRIIAALNIFSHKFGIPEKRGTIIDIKLTHKDLANYTALSRETASRTISLLIKSGDIELIENKYYLLKPAFFKKVLFM
jgi:CRP/FNR family cyclic AMP-dependent transcriptional regulator